MRYKIGDKVKVKSNLGIEKKYGDFVLTPLMSQPHYPIVTIEDYYDFKGYFVKENDFVYTDEMLEEKVTENIFDLNTLQSGDVCVFGDGIAEIFISNGDNIKYFIREDPAWKDIFEDIYKAFYDEETEDYDKIVEIYRPFSPSQSSYNKKEYIKGKLIYKRTKDKEIWINKWYDKFKEFFEKRKLEKNYTIDWLIVNTTLYIVDNKGKVGVAICSKDDEFDFKTGIAIAFAKYMGEKIPKNI